LILKVNKNEVISNHYKINNNKSISRDELQKRKVRKMETAKEYEI